jgi:hypothetical protein
MEPIFGFEVKSNPISPRRKLQQFCQKFSQLISFLAPLHSSRHHLWPNFFFGHNGTNHPIFLGNNLAWTFPLLFLYPFTRQCHQQSFFMTL